MSFITAAIIGGVAAVGAGYIASQGAQSAADTQSRAQMGAANIGLQEFQNIQAQEQPYMQGGYGALNALEYGLGIPSSGGYGGGPINGWGGMGGGGGGYGGYGGIGFNGDPGSYGNIFGAGGRMHAGGPGGDPRMQGPRPGGPGGAPGGPGYGSLLAPFTADMMKQYSPAYGFQLQQGRQAVQNGNASSVGALSGASNKDLIDYNQSLAGTAFNNAFNQYQTQQGNIYNRLFGLAQLGQNAASQTGAQGANLAANIGQSVASAGAARAAGQVGSANAWSGALSSAAPWLAYGAGGSGTPPQYWGDTTTVPG